MGDRAEGLSLTDVVTHNLKRLRTGSGRSQRWLADAAGMSRTNLVNIEAGRTSTTIESLGNLAAALGVRPTALLEPPDRCPTCGRTFDVPTPGSDREEPTP